MADERSGNGGKFPNRDRGMALSEFENEMRTNRQSPPPPPGVADFEEHRRARDSKNRMPSIGIAGAIGIGALVLASSFIFFARRVRRRPAEREPERDDY